MAMHAPQRGSFVRGQQNQMQAAVLPAPIKGMDGRLNLAANDPGYCLYAYNIVPTEYGMRTREGYREYQTDVETAPAQGTGVRSLVPYHVATPHPASGDKLFAVTNEGIWDVTIDGGTPLLSQAFTITTGEAGWANYTHYTDQAGLRRLFVADEENGLYEWDGVAWSRPAITGVDPANVVFVVVHKLRVWLVERDSTTGWYLAPGAIAGAATPFYFGSKFKTGGDLVGLYNWSLDSGSGVDDYLVAISRAGDVIPYRGPDPSSETTWESVGTYYIGDVPQGRRIADEFGGNLHMLSSFGLVAMSDLLKGLDLVTEGDELTQKVGRFLREDMLQYLDDYGWEIRFNTSEGVLMVGTPVRVDGQYLQYRMHIGIKAWAFWRDVPMLTGISWHERYVFGTVDNRVCRMDVPLDNVQLSDPNSGAPVSFSFLYAYLDMGAPGQLKWGDHLRLNWLSQQQPAFDAKWLYDYVTVEIPDVGSIPGTEGSLWDVATWDDGVWLSGAPVPFINLRGGWGPGRTMAAAIRGNTYERATLISVDALWHAGGPF